MGKYFSALGKAEQAAVAAHARAEYDALVQRGPGAYAARHAQADPAGWQDSLRELIAGDKERVIEIILKARRTGKPQEEPRLVNGLHTPLAAQTRRKVAMKAGFTLIEMAIVLVIIGLIVGGILGDEASFKRRPCAPKSRRFSNTGRRCGSSKTNTLVCPAIARMRLILPLRPGDHLRGMAMDS